MNLMKIARKYVVLVTSLITLTLCILATMKVLGYMRDTKEEIRFQDLSLSEAITKNEKTLDDEGYLRITLPLDMINTRLNQLWKEEQRNVESAKGIYYNGKEILYDKGLYQLRAAVDTKVEQDGIQLFVYGEPLLGDKKVPGFFKGGISASQKVFNLKAFRPSAYEKIASITLDEEGLQIKLSVNEKAIASRVEAVFKSSNEKLYALYNSSDDDFKRMQQVKWNFEQDWGYKMIFISDGQRQALYQEIPVLSTLITEETIIRHQQTLKQDHYGYIAKKILNYVKKEIPQNELLVHKMLYYQLTKEAYLTMPEVASRMGINQDQVEQLFLYVEEEEPKVYLEEADKKYVITASGMNEVANRPDFEMKQPFVYYPTAGEKIYQDITIAAREYEGKTNKSTYVRYLKVADNSAYCAVSYSDDIRKVEAYALSKENDQWKVVSRSQNFKALAQDNPDYNVFAFPSFEVKRKYKELTIFELWALEGILSRAGYYRKEKLTPDFEFYCYNGDSVYILLKNGQEFIYQYRNRQLSVVTDEMKKLGNYDPLMILQK